LPDQLQPPGQDVGDIDEDPCNDFEDFIDNQYCTVLMAHVVLSRRVRQVSIMSHPYRCELYGLVL
jgi:hypothetical protein